ncbi:MAG: type III polyketide synthase [Sandarakinorhabdus sp.]|jgi:predicted naringenin-chalcone synthase|nr:type III polyketide synthase [Sandarakinorhabdus sp.]
MPAPGSSGAVAHINRIGTALPPNDVHEAFVDFVGTLIKDRRDQLIFKRLVGRSAINHRWSHFTPVKNPDGFTADEEGFYRPGAFPSTARRMARFADVAPGLAEQAIGGLALSAAELKGITHLVVASCTGMVAPGIDQILVGRLGLDPGVERTHVGFMGCYAAVNSLRLAHHFVRSNPQARVLVVNLELCTLHFQETGDLESLLAMLLFGDGCSAALVTAEASGLALTDFRAATIADSADAITWNIGDQGFDMHLSGRVPPILQGALAGPAGADLLRGRGVDDYGVWAVHGGGRAILDAVEAGLGLGQGALNWSRDVLRDCGNMSSATLMFVLQRIMAGIGTAVPRGVPGFGVAFGPGLAAESFRFETVG